MSDETENMNFALVPKSFSALGKAEPGAKRILALIVTETLALTQTQKPSARTIVAAAQVENWFQTGEKYYYGRGIPQDYAQAMTWYRKAAEQGHAGAQTNLGVCYELGHNYVEAVKWYRVAAGHEITMAQFNLGRCYDFGRGVPQDHGEAVKWYRKAAEAGYADAQRRLGECNEEGRRILQDLSEAYKWYTLAAEQGDTDAAKALAVLSPTMSSDQLEEAERRCREFKTNR